MCGICGFYKTTGISGSYRVLKEMTDALAHRGPDDEGFLEEAGLALGHRRLKVIDLETGQQPMTSRDGRVTLIFNGEIYNFREIRRLLEAKGRCFKTRSDTESLLQFYEEKGIECLKDLEGMFAFAIFDRREASLFLAVDRFQKKPLYYAEKNGGLVFASELKSLMRHPALSKTIDTAALAEYLAFEYVPPPKSIFQGVRKLEAGTYLEMRGGAAAAVKRYWKPDYSLAERDESEWQDVLMRRLKDSVRRRLVSDVPLGVFLSGGLDSSSLLSLIKEMHPEKTVKTFTIGFKEPSFDESSYAKTVSTYFKTEHIVETCSVDQMRKEHQAILGTLDEPLADASYIPTFMLCRLARKHVTVALSGDGGDELFAGYPTFPAHRIAGRIERLPKGVLRALQKLVNRLPVSRGDLSTDFKLKQFFKGIFYKEPVRDQVWLGAFSDEEIGAVLHREHHALSRSVYEVLRRSLEESPEDPVQRLQDFYLKFYLQGDILVKTDRASMANSLEVRSPLLDDRFFAEVARLPSHFKLKGGHTKVLYKQMMQGRLPQGIIHRPKKGFGIPIAEWIRGDLRSEFTGVLDPKKLRKDGLFNEHQVQSVLEQHLTGRKDNRKQLWTLYVFQRWKERWLG